MWTDEKVLSSFSVEGFIVGRNYDDTGLRMKTMGKIL
jgi:hypothetical protein